METYFNLTEALIGNNVLYQMLCDQFSHYTVVCSVQGEGGRLESTPL